MGNHCILPAFSLIFHTVRCHSDAYAAGELKHGTISLITDGVPVIALATQKQVYEKTISNAKETKSRGARVILFTTKDVVVPEGVADYVVRLDDYDELPLLYFPN